MKAGSNQMILAALAALATLTLSSCTQRTPEGDPSEYETALRGTAEILCDEQIYDLMLPVKALYDSVHPDANVTLTPVDAQFAANELIDHKARGIVIAREWLPSEDSMVASGEGEGGFPRTLLARDALVFFTSPDFPIDTLNAEDIKVWMSGGTVDAGVYPQLKGKPTFLVPGSSSSVYANITNVVNKGSEPPRGAVSSAGTMDSVKAAVLANKNYIGVGYLSRFVKDSSVKMLRLSYVDKDGYYERPKPVHAGYLIQGKYPFPVPIYIILRDRASNYSLPSGFMLYVARDAAAQRTFNDAGIEAGYAKYELIIQD